MCHFVSLHTGDLQMIHIKLLVKLFCFSGVLLILFEENMNILSVLY